MTDKISKSLAKLTAKEKQQVRIILKQLLANDTRGLNLVKLKGSNEIYRVRKGNLRIIFQTSPKSPVNVLAIERRSEKTYKAF